MKTKKFTSNIKSFFEIIFSISGYVPKHATIIRTLAFLFSFFLVFYLTIFHPKNSEIAIIYFIISIILYFGFITFVLRKNGYRLWFIKKWGKERGYLIYEGILGFLFFNTGASISYVSLSTSGKPFGFVDENFLLFVVVFLFITGFVTKIWSTAVTSIDTYYWRDMFLRKKICKFTTKGPYKYISNPMYSVGQLQSYAVAIYYQSVYGLIVAVLYQLRTYLFYYNIEKRFLKEIYRI